MTFCHSVLPGPIDRGGAHPDEDLTVLRKTTVWQGRCRSRILPTACDRAPPARGKGTIPPASIQTACF